MNIFLVIFSLILSIGISAFNYDNLKFQRTFSFLEFLVNFILISVSSIYIFKIFGENQLALINLICFIGLYICSKTDIYFKNIFPALLIVLSIPIVYLNYRGEYTIISILAVITAFLLYFSIYVFGRFVYKKEVFGFGDIYILMFIGLVTDSFTVVNIGLFAFVVCLSYYFAKAIVKRNFKILKDYEIPFVPFITISYLIIIYF